MRAELLHITDYSEILRTFGLSYKPYGYYWQVGNIERVQGWTIWLSTIQRQFSELFHTVIPIMMEQDISFRILRDFDTGGQMLEGSLGYPILGMVMGIYPENDQSAASIASMLISITGNFRGPAIPSARHLGGIVHVRYGSMSPIVKMDENGQTREFIQAHTGSWIPDPYSVPFAMPEPLNWPFSNITTPYPPKKPKLINRRYYPLQNLKPDAKGDVIRGLYFRRFWEIKSCIIKQARHDMLSDPQGRDIQDRLRWQYKLYQDLHTTIPMPEVFEYFEMDGDSYLAMQFIDGIPITGIIDKICKSRCWRHLSMAERSSILGRLIDIVEIIMKLHEKGYVHRDIQPDNFLIDKKRKVFLIDMELTYSIKEGYPDPPFQLGTQGHMSPEQHKALTPTFKEDIYGLGALIIMALTSIPAIKINTMEVCGITQSLEFFTGDSNLSSLVASCCSKIPNERPELSTILKALVELKNAPDSISISTSELKPITPESLDNIINAGIRGLTHEKLHSQGRWVSLLEAENSPVGNTQIAVTIYEGWHTGISGVLWTLSRAHRSGFSIEPCLENIYLCWEHLQDTYFSNPNSLPAGLYSGSGGIAMAISENIRSGLLQPHHQILEDLKQCFWQTSELLDLADGVAGQGIALLNSAEYLDKKWVSDKLMHYKTIIADAQLPDGTWPIYSENNKPTDILLGLSKGVAGVCWYLLHYYNFSQDESTVRILIRSLDWLVHAAKNKNGHYYWTTTLKCESVDPWTVNSGLPGIALLFMLAYEKLGTPLYKTIAETSLSTIPHFPVKKDLSLSFGLAGLSEVYMEAYSIFKDKKWQIRSNWIRQMLTNSYTQLASDMLCWQTSMNYTLSADLSTGSCGIIYTLTQNKSGCQIRHPMIPIY